MAGRAPFLPENISRYIGEHAVREPQILRELRAATASVPNSGMQIGADQGQFMALLVQAIGARNCLEIGTYTGYSALAVALALPKDGRIVCCDISEEWTAVGKPFWKKAGVDKKIAEYVLHERPEISHKNHAIAEQQKQSPNYPFT